MIALTGMRRMISRLDRRQWSPTFGCFDREYWHYKTLIEFPRANFQQCVWGLTLLYRTPFDGNEFAGKPETLAWIKAALNFWRRMRHSDGSVDEWYRNERSFCATAYNAAAVGETLLLAKEEFDGAFRQQMINALDETCAWLRRHQNLPVANQMVAGLLAHDCLRRLDSRRESDYAGWKSATLSLQHAEGWFPEYGGADIGYSLLTLDLLTHLARRCRDADIGKAVAKLEEFLSWCLLPVHDFGSRGAIHGFRYAGPNVLTADDTYAAYFYVNSACLQAAGAPLLELPVMLGRKVFPGAGFVAHRTAAYHAVINTQRGAWRVQYANGRRAGDAGYVVKTADGKLWTSGRPEATAPDITDTGVTVVKRLAALDADLPLVRHVVAFKWVTNVLLEIPALAYWFAGFVKRRKVCAGRAGSLQVRRQWRFSETGVEVEDALPAEAASSWRAGEGTGMHSPSSQLCCAEGFLSSK